MPAIRVVVAEDFAPFREFVCTRLTQRGGIDVSTAADGRAAVERAAAIQPHLVLLDIGLPALDGLAAARQIRTASPQSKIVFVTQESAPEIVEAALDLGCDGYIHKMRALNFLMPTAEALLACQDSVPRNHHVHFYSSDEVLLDTAERIVAAALDAEDAAIVAMTGAHLTMLTSRLRNRGVPIDHAAAAGTFAGVDVGELRDAVSSRRTGSDRPYGSFRPLYESTARATNRPAPRIAVVGECGAVLYGAGHGEVALALERDSDSGIRTGEAGHIDLTCLYPLADLCTEEAFAELCAEHSAVVVR